MSNIELPLETAALVTAARQALWSGDARPFRAAAQSDIEIDIDVARRHGMLAWAPNVPIAIGRTHAQQALRGIHHLHEAADALEKNRIPFVAFKGPVLAQWLYGDACARRFSDIDLLVSADRAAAALTALESLGYRRRSTRGPDAVAHRWIGAWPMRRGEDDVDLHWRLLGPRFGRFLDTEHVVTQSVPVTVAGRALPAPRPEHAAALLIAHSAKHLWYAMEYAFALAAVTRRAMVDWDEVFELLSAAGASNAGATGFSIIKALFDIDPPAAFLTAVSRGDVRSLHALAMRSLSLPPGVFPDRRLDRELQRLSFDRRIDRVRYDFLRVFEPTQADCEWVDLPERLSLLYWVVRPLRLAARELQR